MTAQATNDKPNSGSAAIIKLVRQRDYLLDMVGLSLEQLVKKMQLPDPKKIRQI